MSEISPTRRGQRQAADAPQTSATDFDVPGPRRSAAALAPEPVDRGFGATEWRPAEGIPAATVAAAPRRPAPPITGTPVFSPVRTEVPPAGSTPEATRIGWDPGRASLSAAGGAIRPLETAAEVLPELEEAEARARPVWRHPAFLLSAGMTLLALVALVVFLVFGAMSPRATASGLALDAGDDNVRVTWSGPNVPYQLIVVGGPGGDELDVSQLVRGTEAWIPTGAGLIDDRACVVVRPAAGNDTAPVALDAATLDGQGAVSACVADD